MLGQEELAEKMMHTLEPEITPELFNAAEGDYGELSKGLQGGMTPAQEFISGGARAVPNVVISGLLGGAPGLVGKGVAGVAGKALPAITKAMINGKKCVRIGRRSR